MSTSGIEADLPVLPSDLRKGLIAISVLSSISLATTLFLLLYLVYTKLIRPAPSFPTQQQSFHGLFWLINLFIADFLQSIALTLNTYDISQNSVLPGIGCNAQGFFINIGDVSSAWWTLVITLHTFLIIAGGNKVRIWVIEKSKSGKLRWIFAITLWICAFFLSTVGLFLIQYVEKKGPFYNSSGAGWCWIGDNYFWYRIFFHYVFLFFNLLVLPTLYITLFFIVRFHSKSMKEWNSIHNKSSPLPSERDSIALCDHSKSTFQFAPAQEEACSRQITTADSRGKESAYKRINHVSKTLLLYPIAYLCCSMPITTARIAQFTGAPVPIPVVFFAAGIYGATGFVNVVLYTVTRKGIVSFDWLRRWRKGS